MTTSPIGALPLVGRRAELARLAGLVESARAGQGLSVLVSGRAGLGKSRLLAEFARASHDSGAMVLSATAERGPVLRPHDLVLQLLTAAVIQCRARRLEPPSEIESAIARLESRGDDLGRASTLTAVMSGLLALPVQPVVVVVDDVHWADAASAEVLRSLGTYLHTLPIVALRAQRPDPRAMAREGRSTMIVELDVLRAGQLADMLATHTSLSSEQVHEAAATLVRLGGDVPAVLEHLVASAGGIDDSTASVEFMSHLSLLTASRPDEVTALRVASLAPWSREVLSAASVLGREIDVMVLEQMLRPDGAHETIDAALQEAIERGVVVRSGPGEHRFSHPLVPEVLFEQTPLSRRSELHRRAATALAAAGDHQLLGAARHAIASGRLDDSHISLIVAAAENALDLSAFAEATDLFDTALGLGLEHDERIRITLLHGLALRGLGRRHEARSKFEDVVAMATSPTVRHFAIEAAIRHAEGGDFRVGAAQSATLIDQLLDIGGLDDAQRARLLAAKVRVSARVDRVVKHIDANDLFAVGPLDTQDRVQWSYAVRTTLAHDLSREAIEWAERSTDQHALLESLAAWRSVHRSPHFLARRTERGATAVDIADRLGRRAEGVELRGWLAVDHVERGDRRAFDVVAAEVEATMGRFGTHPLHWLAANLRTLVAQLDGRPSTIADLATAAAKVEVDYEVPGRWTALAILLWRAGELVDDRHFARSLSSKHPDIFDQVASASMLGLSRSRDGLGDDARGLLDGAMERLRLHEVEISWLLSLHAVADLIVEIEALEYASEVVELIRPWVDRVTIGNHGTVILGPIARPFASLLALVGEPDDDIAVALSTAHRLAGQLRAPVFAAETALDEARWHRRRRRYHDAARCARDVLKHAVPVGALRLKSAAEQLLDDLPIDTGPHWSLTTRQLDILEAMSNGLTNPEIASELAFSLSTVAKETSEIYRQLDVPGREQAVREYRRRRHHIR